MASYSSTSSCLAGFLMILMVFSFHANGCYTSIISFGDSIADTGNVKHLASITNKQFPSLSPPYGETFFHRPTGRSSNGRLIIDFLAHSLGLSLIPPYMTVRGSDKHEPALGQGINYAVGAATALDSLFLESKGIYNAVSNASLRVQLGWFRHSLSSICGNALDCRKSLIGRSLILMGEIGGNDYNFLLGDGRPIDEVEPYVPLVVDTIISAINELIEIGAKTLVVPGNFPIGCFPVYLTIRGSEKEEYDASTGCLIRLNKFAEHHNKLLQMKLNQIREVHPNVNIIYADYYNAAMKIYRSPDKFGFTNDVLKACCGGGGPYNYNLSATCGDASATVCNEPHKYASWDGVHPTEATYKLIFESLFQGPYTTPQFNSLCPASTSQLGIKSSSSSSSM